MNNPNISKTSGFTKFTRVLLFIYILSGIGVCDSPPSSS